MIFFGFGAFGEGSLADHIGGVVLVSSSEIESSFTKTSIAKKS